MGLLIQELSLDHVMSPKKYLYSLPCFSDENGSISAFQGKNIFTS